jgi:hypothetical protein
VSFGAASSEAQLLQAGDAAVALKFAAHLAPFEPPPLPHGSLAWDLAVRHRGELSLSLACASAPSSLWVPGVEDAVLGYASWLAQGAAGRSVNVTTTTKEGHLTRQALVGGAGSHGGSLAGWHSLGFSESRAHVCTLLCEAPEPLAARCSAIAAESRLEGAAQPPPKPAAWARAALSLADPSPWHVVAFALLGTWALARLLTRRPRRR